MSDASDPNPYEPSEPAEGPSGAWIDLSGYRLPEGYSPGRGRLVQIAWLLVSVVFFESGWFILGGVKLWLLRQFGARIGHGVVLKPNVRIKFPWRLTIGDHAWIGQGVWIDNLAPVEIGAHVCVSQGVYFCTGSHDHRSAGFDLITKPITVQDGAWVAARSTLLPGVTIGANALVAGGAVVAKDVPPAKMVGGNPPRELGERRPPSPRG